MPFLGARNDFPLRHQQRTLSPHLFSINQEQTRGQNAKSDEDRDQQHGASRYGEGLASASRLSKRVPRPTTAG